MADIKAEDLKIEMYDANRQTCGQVVPEYDPNPFKVRITYLPTNVQFTAEDRNSFLEAKSTALHALRKHLDSIRRQEIVENYDWQEYE